MKKLSANFPVSLSGRAVPLGFNLDKNRYPLPVNCHGATTQINVWLYEYHGMYWFGFQANGKDVNSAPYVSDRDCVCGLRAFLRTFGFRFEDSALAESRIKLWRASFVSAPKSFEV